MAVSDGFLDEAAGDGAFFDAARLTVSSLLFAATPALHPPSPHADDEPAAACLLRS